MIKNPNELAVLIKTCERQIKELEQDIKYHAYKNDKALTADLRAKQNLLKRKILSYIRHYKTIVDQHSIDQKIFGDFMAYLEQGYERKYGGLGR